MSHHFRHHRHLITTDSLHRAIVWHRAIVCFIELSKDTKFNDSAAHPPLLIGFYDYFMNLSNLVRRKKKRNNEY